MSEAAELVNTTMVLPALGLLGRDGILQQSPG